MPESAARARADRLLLLQFGGELIPRSLSVAGAPPLLAWVPVFGALVRTAAGWVLLETGVAPGSVADPAVQAMYVRAAEGDRLVPGDERDACLSHPAVGEADGFLWARPFAEVLAEQGVAPADLALAAVSHLHVDHTGGLRELAAAGVPVAIQRAELDFARTDEAVEGGLRRADLDADLAWRVLDGDAELAPGLHALATPGHTPGHMSYRVELEETGSWLLAIDAADVGQNLLDLRLPGSCAAGEAAARASLRRLLDEARRRGARLLPGHDQLALDLAAHPRGGHR
jgi:N-acyl homoserine lactone hydrolase